ncbi:MAG: sodium:solute symporter family protein [Negativicutes bacterium]|nr:sodium:solute symporter family protein [Negativicutes bacterium]
MTATAGLLAVYAAILLAISWLAGRRTRTAGDFFVAGRNLTPFWLFISLVAPNIGAGSTIGVAGLAYRYGWVAGLWTMAAAAGTAVLALVVGPRIWQQARQHQLLTVGDWLAWRYGGRLRNMVSATMAVGALALFAGQLLGMAYIVHVLSGLERGLAVTAAATVVGVYFAAGGIRATLPVNLCEVVVKFAGFVAVAIWLLTEAGERLWPAVTEGSSAGWVPVSWFALLLPAFFSSPALLGKIFAADSPATVRRGGMACAAAMAVFAVIPVLIGIAARGSFPGLAEPETALPLLMAGRLPAWLAALALAAIVSAELSAADAILYMIAGAVARDLASWLPGRPADDNRLIRRGRLAGLAAAAAGAVVAVKIRGIIAALSAFYALMTVAVTVPLLFGLWSHRCRQGQAVAASVAGGLLTVAGQVFGWPGWGWLTPPTAGLGLAALIMTGFFLGNRGGGQSDCRPPTIDRRGDEHG